MSKFAVVLFLVWAVVAQAFVPSSRTSKARMAPLHENFFLDIGEFEEILASIVRSSCSNNF